ncbi:MarR family transcriptional regulator [Dactylosporangium vinaceum]|nr:MarR family transcriptional regulator [Dactylosporangium vinaceum]
MVRWAESRHVRGEVASRSGSDLQPSELRLLEFFDLAEPMRISDIAECLQIDISTTSLQLRQLRKKQLVEAVPMERDRRATMIVITDDGRRMVARVRAARLELLREIFAGIPGDRLDQVAEVLLLVEEHMLEGMRRLIGADTTG